MFVALVYNGWVIALIMLGVVLLVQQVEGHVLQPLIMGTAVKVHPLAVVLAVAAGSLLAGIPGALFAVPVAAVLNVMVLSIAAAPGTETPPDPPRRTPRCGARFHNDPDSDGDVSSRSVRRARRRRHVATPHGGAVHAPRALDRDGGPPARADPRRLRARRERVVARVARRTPMETSRYLAELLGAPVFLKCENLQRTGSYKIRGAYNRLSQLTDEERARGVVAASAGNHAQGVAFAARELGISATIFMPVGVALPKLAGHPRLRRRRRAARRTRSTRRCEAAAEFADGDRRDPHPAVRPPRRRSPARARSASRSSSRCPMSTTVIVPIGGGGLAAGVASAAQAARRGTRPHDPRHRRAGGERRRLPASLDSGEPTEVPVVPTIADGIAVTEPGELNFEIIREVVDEVVTVSEDDIARALLVLLERAKLVVEPAGAVGGRGDPGRQDRAPTDRRSSCSPAATSTRCSCSG